MNKIGIYKITSPSGRIYIGQSINILKRWINYQSLLKNNQTKLYNSFIKYGIEKHVFEIIEECSLNQLDEQETYWKQYYLNQFNNDWSQVLFCELYDKGGGPRSKETKLKMSQAKLGKVCSQEHRNNISKVKKGNESKRKKKVFQYDLQDNLLKEYDSLSQAANFIKGVPSNISNVCLGKQKTYKKFKWKFN
jgi:hypothetical protein